MREQKRGGGKGKEKRTCLSVERVRNVCRNECIVLELGDTLEIKVRERRSFARHGCVLLRSAALCYFATRRDVLYSLSLIAPFPTSDDMANDENGDSGLIARGRR